MNDKNNMNDKRISTTKTVGDLGENPVAAEINPLNIPMTVDEFKKKMGWTTTQFNRVRRRYGINVQGKSAVKKPELKIGEVIDFGCDGWTASGIVEKIKADGSLILRCKSAIAFESSSRLVVIKGIVYQIKNYSPISERMSGVSYRARLKYLHPVIVVEITRAANNVTASAPGVQGDISIQDVEDGMADARARRENRLKNRANRLRYKQNRKLGKAGKKTT